MGLARESIGLDQRCEASPATRTGATGRRTVGGTTVNDDVASTRPSDSGGTQFQRTTERPPLSIVRIMRTGCGPALSSTVVPGPTEFQESGFTHMTSTGRLSICRLTAPSDEKAIRYAPVRGARSQPSHSML